MLSKWAQEKRLFKQAVLMSGNAVLTTRPLAHQDNIYRKFLSHCKIPETIPAAERVEQLRNVSTDDLLEAYIATGQIIPNWQGTEDGFLIESLPTFSGLSAQTYGPHIQRIIVGDCDKEVRVIHGLNINIINVDRECFGGRKSYKVDGHQRR